jgi:hypothetical protein
LIQIGLKKARLNGKARDFAIPKTAAGVAPERVVSESAQKIAGLSQET